MLTGFVVRCMNVLPSERVTSCVKVYGRFGRRRREACRHCCVDFEVDGEMRRQRGEGRTMLILPEMGYEETIRLANWNGNAGRIFGPGDRSFGCVRNWPATSRRRVFSVAALSK